MFNYHKMFLYTFLSVILSSITLVNAGTRNFIMVIPDGFGPASESLTRDFVHWKHNSTTTLPIDEMVVGQIRTRSHDSYVTDSAAAATAYSCGVKSYNGAIGVDHEGKPRATVLEAAKRKGYKTGLVVTSRITHATPAGFASHVIHRDFESSIASQLVGKTHPLGQTVDILMGGGLCFFLPIGSEGSCRTDDTDLITWARGNGFEVLAGEGSRQGFDDWDSEELGRRIASASTSTSTSDSLKNLDDDDAYEAQESKTKAKRYMGLFSLDHMSYTIDRDPEVQPSLTEMAIKALDALFVAATTTTTTTSSSSTMGKAEPETQGQHSSETGTEQEQQADEDEEDDTPGFFIMIEASRIDHAGHQNDALTHINEILEFNRVMDAVRGWIDRHAEVDGEQHEFTLVATADHETGGLTLGDEYWLEPGWFDVDIGVFDGGLRGSGSAEKLSERWRAFDATGVRGGSSSVRGVRVDVSEYVTFLKEEVFRRYGITNPSEEEVKEGMKLKNDGEGFAGFLKGALDGRTRVDWSTGGHTAVDVTLYSHSTLPHSKWLKGNHENIEVSKYISELLGLDDALVGVTEELNASKGFVESEVRGGRGRVVVVNGEVVRSEVGVGLTVQKEGQMQMALQVQTEGQRQRGLALTHYHH
ncbi:alkaline phosphatase-like protein [Pluteus cervinus]|uniref:Alkaline phosphatase-like protein n=2 Tax=Pluteus cervinus TaxID=181527 RepID=A0ACD3AB47_9AGAR|nr:alkaline phosphatase-like protein [Pluteus cervinus]TFK62901.1 alkaline phosphatase-like protein [Pluteus cervinus]